MKLQTHRIITKDLTGSLKWYTEFFGTSPIQTDDRFASFIFNGFSLDLVQEDAKNPVSNGGSIGYWLVDDLEEVSFKAIMLGAEIYRGPLNIPEINRAILQIKEPNGSIIGFEANINH